MKFAFISSLVLSTVASAHPVYHQQATPTGSFHEWAPAGLDDCESDRRCNAPRTRLVR